MEGGRERVYRGIRCELSQLYSSPRVCSAANRHSNSVELPISSPSLASETPSFTLSTYPAHRLLITSRTPDSESDKLLHEAAVFDESEFGVDFHPLPRQYASAEVHIPSPSYPQEVVSTSVRVSGDEFATPRSSLVNQSPLAVVTDTLTVPMDTPSPTSNFLPSSHDMRSFGPAHRHAVRGSDSLKRSLKLPINHRNRIILSSEASSNASSCDGDESELTSEDSEDVPQTRYLAPNVAAHNKRFGGSCENLASGGPLGGYLRSQSVSPTQRPSSQELYSEDDTVLVTRRRVESQTRRSFFNLSPSPSMEVVEFSTPLSGSSSLGRSASMRLSRERNPSPFPQLPLATISRTVPLSAITHTQ